MVGGRLWFSTGGRSRKSLNLEADARCSVSSERADEAVIIEGTAERITDGPTLQRLVVVYADKYGGPPPADEPVYAVSPDRAFGFVDDEAAFVEVATRWTFPGRA